MGERGRVYAFEPDPRNCAVLRRNVALNGLNEIIEVKEIALSDISGWTKFFLADGDPSTSSIVYPDSSARQITVPCARLDEILAYVKMVNFLKIDAEGAETQILRDARDIISRSPDIWILCEVNPQALIAGGSSPRELVEVFEDYGFTIGVIDESNMTVYALSENPTHFQGFNVLAHRGLWRIGNLWEG